MKKILIVLTEEQHRMLNRLMENGWGNGDYEQAYLNKREAKEIQRAFKAFDNKLTLPSEEWMDELLDALQYRPTDEGGLVLLGEDETNLIQLLTQLLKEGKP